MWAITSTSLVRVWVLATESSTVYFGGPYYTGTLREIRYTSSAFRSRIIWCFEVAAWSRRWYVQPTRTFAAAHASDRVTFLGPVRPFKRDTMAVCHGCLDGKNHSRGFALNWIKFSRDVCVENVRVSACVTTHERTREQARELLCQYKPGRLV